MQLLDIKANELKELLCAETEAELSEVEGRVVDENGVKRYTLADAIREGSMVSNQAYNWGDGEKACALTAAVIAAKAHNYI